MFPIRVLFLPLHLLGLFHTPELAVSDSHFRPPLSRRIWNWINRAVQTPFWGIASFFRAIWRRFVRLSWMDWLWVSPLIGMALFLAFVFGTRMFRSEAIDNQYHREARLAFAKEDFALAKSYFERYQKEAKLTPVQMFFWAEILQKTGEPEKAAEIVDSLAPVGEVGVAQAHLIKALNISAELKQNPKQLKSEDPFVLRKLKWHLTHCKSESPTILEAWALLHANLGELDEAIRYLKQSSQKQPLHYLLLANLCNRAKRIEDRDDALRSAEQVFSARIELDRSDNSSRLLLADTLIKQSKFIEAEKVLMTAYLQEKSPQVAKKTASLYLLQFDLLQRKGGNVEKLFQFLTRAVKLQPDNLSVFKRMMVLYQTARKESPEAETALLDSLRELASGGDESALANVALSQVYQLNKDNPKAIFHLEAAVQLEPNFALAQNNLAWLLANQDSPDLERALGLAKKAAKSLPNNGQIADTLGSILMQLGNFQEASRAFRTAIDATPKKPELHDKMAKALEQLDMKDMAEVHRRRAAELRTAN